MRGILFTGSLILALALPAGAQNGIPSLGGGARSGGAARPGGLIQGGPGRITSPTPVRPAAPTTGVRPGVPDARLGAGGVHPNTGNVVYPGTPGNNQSVGNILSPGIPAVQPIPPVQPIPSVVQPARPSIQDVDRQGGRHAWRGGRYRAPISYPIYGVYSYPFAPNVIAVTGNTVTRSGSGYVVTVGGEPAPEQQANIQAEQPAESSVVELGDDKLEPDYWLIALQGGLIYAASEYTVEGRAFRFKTLQGDEYVVPLAELDVDFTVKLNHDRGVEIELE